MVSLQLIKVNEKKKYLLKKKNAYEANSAQGYVPGLEVQQWKKQALVPALQEIYTHSGEQKLSKEKNKYHLALWKTSNKALR